MALQKKKRFDNPVKCSMCKERKAYHTAHGGLVHGGGRTICNDCYPTLQEQERGLIEKEYNYEPTEADYQTWMRL